MVHVKDILPTNPVKPVQRRWHAPDDEQPNPHRKQNQTADPTSESDDGHIDEYA